MKDKQETKMTLRESYAHAQLEDEAFEREFECCRKMKSAKPEPAPHPELLGKLGKDLKTFDEIVDKTWAKVGRTGNPDIAIASRLRKERDDLKERCSDLDLQVDRLEAQLSKSKLENVTLKDTVIALKECESVKGQASEPAGWDGEGLPPVGCECEYFDKGHSDKWIPVKIIYSSEWGVVCESLAPESRGVELFFNSFKDPKFRPIESPEQKAQREREEAISEIESTLHDRIHFNNSCLPRTIATCLVDNGYRKQP